MHSYRNFLRMTDLQRESYEFPHATSYNRALYFCLNNKDDWLSDPCIHIYPYIHTTSYTWISPTYVFVSIEVFLKIPIASWYLALALHNTAEVTIYSLPIFDVRNGTIFQMEPSTKIQDQIRDTRRLSLFWFKTYRRVSLQGVSWSGDWLQIFVFPFSLPSARYTLYPQCTFSSTEKPHCKIRARSCDFSKEEFVQADDRKQIKSAEIYTYISIHIEKKKCALPGEQ